MIQYAEELDKGIKAVADAIMAQVDDIVEDIYNTNKKIEELENTPKKRYSSRVYLVKPSKYTIC